MLYTIASEKIQMSARLNEQGLEILFREAAVEPVLRFIECTAIGKRRETDDAQQIDEWDIRSLDR